MDECCPYSFLCSCYNNIFLFPKFEAPPLFVVFYLFIFGVIIDTISSSDYIVSNVPGSVSISSEFDVLFTVAKTTVLLADINDFGAVNEVYKQCEFDVTLTVKTTHLVICTDLKQKCSHALACCLRKTGGQIIVITQFKHFIVLVCVVISSLTNSMEQTP